VVFFDNTAANAGGAISVNDNSTLNCEDCFFSGNSITSTTGGIGGGAVHVAGSTVTFYGSTSFISNLAPSQSGGALWIGSNDAATVPSVVIIEAEVTAEMNNATGLSGAGGFLYIERSYISFNPAVAVIWNNLAASRGGGICVEIDSVFTTSMPLNLFNNRVSGAATSFGGNLYIAASAQFTALNTVSLSSGMSATHGGNLAIGGPVSTTGFALFNSSVTLSGGLLTSNVEVGTGCNVYLQNAYANFTSDVTFADGCIARSTSVAGGADLSVFGASQVRLTNPKFTWSESITSSSASRALNGGSLWYSGTSASNLYLTGTMLSALLV
jgi:predicted outer membrane repeat protein